MPPMIAATSLREGLMTDLGGGFYVSRVDSEDYEPGGSVHVLFEEGDTGAGIWSPSPVSRSTRDSFSRRARRSSSSYREIVPAEKLVFSWGATDGWPEPDPERLDESPLVTVTFSEAEGQTAMTVHLELPASLSEDQVQEWFSMGIRDGMRQTVDRL